MKIDYELTKLILEDIEEQSDGQKSIQVVASKIQEGCSQELVDYHLRILEDDALIVVDDRLGAVGTTMISRLTAEGHRVLEAMRDDTFLNKLKSGSMGASAEALKQLPSMFMKMVLTGSAV